MQSKQDRESWSDEDLQWLQSFVASDFQPIAREHGRTLFAMVMKAGIVSGALQALMAGTRGNGELQTNCEVLQQSIDDLYKALLEASGFNAADYAACLDAIQTRALLLQGGRGTVQPTTPGGIVLQ